MVIDGCKKYMRKTCGDVLDNLKGECYQVTFCFSLIRSNISNTIIPSLVDCNSECLGKSLLIFLKFGKDFYFFYDTSKF